MKTRSGVAITREPLCDVYAVRRSPKLETPAIFFSFNDAKPYLSDGKGKESANTNVEFKTFKLLKHAAEYVLEGHPMLQLSLQVNGTGKRKNDDIDDDVDDENDAERTSKRQKTTTNNVAAVSAVAASTSNAASVLVGMTARKASSPATLRRSPRRTATTAVQKSATPTKSKPTKSKPTVPPPPPGYSVVYVEGGKGSLGISLRDGLEVVKSERPHILPGDILIRINMTVVVGWGLQRIVKYLHETSNWERVLLIHRLTTKINKNTPKAKTTTTPTTTTTVAAPAPATATTLNQAKTPSTASTTTAAASSSTDDKSKYGVDWKKRHMQDFETRFRDLETFKEHYGDTDVPLKRAKYRVGDDKYIDQRADFCIGLAQWVIFIRKQLKLFNIDPHVSLLSKDQVGRLKTLDFCMEPIRGMGRSADLLKPAWNEERYQELLAYHEEYGNCEVPTRPNTPLRKWMDRMRLAYSDLEEGIVATITDDEIAKLCDIGFDFGDKRRLGWDESYQRWRNFKAANPDKEPSRSTRLGRWVARNRQLYAAFQSGDVSKQMQLKQEQVDKLNIAGFKWNPNVKKPVVVNKAKTFDERIEELKEYKAKYGDCIVPLLYPGLGSWCASQMQHYRKWKTKGQRSAMTQEKYDKLVEVGFSFEKRKMGPRFHKGKSRYHKGVETGGVPHPLQNRQLTLMAEERKRQWELANNNNAPQDSADNNEAQAAVEAGAGNASDDVSATFEEGEDQDSDGVESIDGNLFL